MVDFNTLIDPLSGWKLTDAAAINGAGQITRQAPIKTNTTLSSLRLIFNPGDFKHDGSVNVADYVIWRNGLGTTYTQADHKPCALTLAMRPAPTRRTLRQTQCRLPCGAENHLIADVCSDWLVSAPHSD